MATVTELFRGIRERLGLSQNDYAKELGYKAASSIQRYESENYEKDVLPIWVTKKVEAFAVGRGDPPITREEVLALSGLAGRGLLPSAPEAKPIIDIEGDEYAPIAVYNCRAAAGAGANGSDIVASHVLFRLQWLRSVTGAPIERLGMIEVDGDSLEPTLRSGDNVLVDTTETHVARNKAGLYVIRADEDLQVKRISAHPQSGKLTISSDNPAYPTYTDIDAVAIIIVGRVIWLGRRV